MVMYIRIFLFSLLIFAQLWSLSPTRESQLIMAAKNDNNEHVYQLLKEGVNPNFQEDFGMNALMYAVLNENEKMANILLAFGADANLQDHSGSSALHLAVSNGNLEITKKILTKIDNINTANALGLTPLIIATLYNKPEIVQLMIENKAKINIKSNENYDALQYAVLLENEAALDIFLQNQQKIVDIKEYDHESLMNLIYEKNNSKEIIEKFNEYNFFENNKSNKDIIISNTKQSNEQEGSSAKNMENSSVNEDNLNAESNQEKLDTRGSNPQEDINHKYSDKSESDESTEFEKYEEKYSEYLEHNTINENQSSNIDADSQENDTTNNDKEISANHEEDTEEIYYVEQFSENSTEKYDNIAPHEQKENINTDNNVQKAIIENPVYYFDIKDYQSCSTAIKSFFALQDKFTIFDNFAEELIERENKCILRLGYFDNRKSAQQILNILESAFENVEIDKIEFKESMKIINLNEKKLSMVIKRINKK